MGWSVVRMEKPVTTPPQFWPFPSDGIPQTFQNFNAVGLFLLWSLQEGTGTRGGQLH